jgi:hypothetical protein
MIVRVQASVVHDYTRPKVQDCKAEEEKNYRCLISCVRHCIEGDRTFSRSSLLICALAIALAKASPKHRA